MLEITILYKHSRWDLRVGEHMIVHEVLSRLQLSSLNISGYNLLNFCELNLSESFKDNNLTNFSIIGIYECNKI